jgi:hypothetical protein
MDHVSPSVCRSWGRRAERSARGDSRRCAARRPSFAFGTRDLPRPGAGNANEPSQPPASDRHAATDAVEMHAFRPDATTAALRRCAAAPGRITDGRAKCHGI